MKLQSIQKIITQSLFLYRIKVYFLGKLSIFSFYIQQADIKKLITVTDCSDQISLYQSVDNNNDH